MVRVLGSWHIVKVFDTSAEQGSKDYMVVSNDSVSNVQ